MGVGLELRIAPPRLRHHRQVVADLSDAVTTVQWVYPFRPLGYFSDWSPKPLPKPAFRLPQLRTPAGRPARQHGVYRPRREPAHRLVANPPNPYGLVFTCLRESGSMPSSPAPPPPTSPSAWRWRKTRLA